MSGIATCILNLIGSLSCLKEAKAMDMVHGKCNFLNSFLIFRDTVVGTYSLLRPFLCFTTKRFEHKLKKNWPTLLHILSICVISMK